MAAAICYTGLAAPMTLTINCEFMILAVDDDKLNLLLLGELLEDGGFAMLEADGIETALDCENDPRIQLLLLDSNLNPGTGSQLLAEIRSREIARGTPRRPAIVVTGDVDDSQQRKLMADGFDQFIAKPYTAAHLIDQINRLLTR